MIHVLALPLLLSGAPPVSATLRAIPEDSIFALHIDGGADLRARLKDNTWLSLAMQASNQAVSEVLEEFDLPAMDAWLEDIDDASVFLARGDHPLGTLGLFVTAEGGGAIQRAFARLRETIEEEVEPTSDEDGIVLYDVSELGFELAGDTDAVELVLVQRGELFGIVASDESGTSARLAAASLDGDGDHPEGLVNVNAELSGTQIGVHFDLAFLSELFDEDLSGPEGEMVAKILEGLGAVGVGLKFGEGGAFEGLVHLAFDEDSLASQFADVFKPFDRGLLDWAPKESTVLSIAGIDFVGFLEVILDMVDMIEPGATDEAMDRLDALADETGVHVIDDVLSLLEGSIMTFMTNLPDIEAIETGEEMPAFGYVIGLEDHEAFEENLLAILEPLGLMEHVDVKELSHGNLYTIPDVPIALGIGVGRGAISLVMGDALSHVEAVLSGGDPPGALENRFLRKALEENEDSVSVAFWDVDLLDTILSLVDAPFEVGDMLDDLEGTFVITSDVSSTAMSLRAELR